MLPNMCENIQYFDDDRSARKEYSTLTKFNIDRDLADFKSADRRRAYLPAGAFDTPFSLRDVHIRHNARHTVSGSNSFGYAQNGRMHGCSTPENYPKSASFCIQIHMLLKG